MDIYKAKEVLRSINIVSDVTESSDEYVLTINLGKFNTITECEEVIDAINMLKLL